MLSSVTLKAFPSRLSRCLPKKKNAVHTPDNSVKRMCCNPPTSLELGCKSSHCLPHNAKISETLGCSGRLHMRVMKRRPCLKSSGHGADLQYGKLINASTLACFTASCSAVCGWHVHTTTAEQRKQNQMDDENV